MYSKILLAAVAVSSLAIPTVEAQPAGGRQENRQIQLPRAGQVSMIGLRLGDVTADQVKTLKLSKQEGAVVESVRPNSPAATAGFHENDVVLQFDGERVRSAAHLTRLVAETPVGREVMVGVIRDGRRTDLKVKPEAGNWFEPRFGGMIDLNAEELKEQMERAGRAAREMGRNLPDVFAPGRGRLGVTVQELNGELAEYFGVKSGVLVASVAPDSPAAKAGVKAGDVITAVNGKAVATPGELVSGLPAADTAQEVALTIFRDRREMTLRVAVAAPASTGKPARGQRV
jgi:serine protease Do